MDDVMTDQEAREYFNQMCQEFFGVSGQEFMNYPMFGLVTHILNLLCSL